MENKGKKINLEYKSLKLQNEPDEFIPSRIVCVSMDNTAEFFLLKTLHIFYFHLFFIPSLIFGDKYYRVEQW